MMATAVGPQSLGGVLVFGDQIVGRNDGQSDRRDEARRVLSLLAKRCRHANV